MDAFSLCTNNRSEGFYRQNVLCNLVSPSETKIWRYILIIYDDTTSLINLDKASLFNLSLTRFEKIIFCNFGPMCKTEFIDCPLEDFAEALKTTQNLVIVLRLFMAAW